MEDKDAIFRYRCYAVRRWLYMYAGSVIGNLAPDASTESIRASLLELKNQLERLGMQDDDFPPIRHFCLSYFNRHRNNP